MYRTTAQLSPIKCTNLRSVLLIERSNTIYHSTVASLDTGSVTVCSSAV